jgi:UDP-N-acetylmuramate: L-alanyl-gamma-D-glutamyl-meso-diaminopimelate ligase
VVGNVEFDHGDIYPDLDAILAAFRAGTALVPPTGRVVANRDDAGARAVAEGHPRVVWYGSDDGCDLRCVDTEVADGGLRIRLAWQGQPFELRAPLVGRHNRDNLLAACACALLAGLDPAAIAAAAATFPGVRRRLEVVGEAAGVTVVDDFAHHPTAVALTLEGARQRFPGHRLVAVFEPRSLTAGRALFAAAYEQAFRAADLALIAPVFHRRRLASEQLLDRAALVAALARLGTAAVALPEEGEIADEVLTHLRVGDAAVCMSSGEFGGLPRRLLARLGGAP